MSSLCRCLPGASPTQEGRHKRKHKGVCLKLNKRVMEAGVRHDPIGGKQTVHSKLQAMIAWEKTMRVIKIEDGQLMLDVTEEGEPVQRFKKTGAMVKATC